MNGHVLVVL